MINKLINLWYRHKTRKLKKIPLFTMFFNFEKYTEQGEKKGNCDWMAHTELINDKFLREEMQKCVDYIRENYDMEIFAKI